MNIQITDYKYIDEFKQGSEVHKKVIAQQVEKVLPEAIKKRVDFIPNIYLASKSIEYSATLATITLEKWKPIEAGEKIRVFNKQNEYFDVTVKSVNAPRFTVEGLSEEKAGKSLFVYGKEVQDFRSVDYDAISMLNVSATQELVRRLESQKAQLDEQKAANDQLRAELLKQKQDIEARLLRLEKAQRLPSSQSTAN